MPKIQRARMQHPTGKPVAVPPVFPNAGVEAWYQSQLDKLVGEMYLDSRAVLIPVLETTPAIIGYATDLEAVPVPTAAGVIFWAKAQPGEARRCLILKRNDAQERYQFWGIPGGKIEAGETAEQAVRRETHEETLYDYRGSLRYLCTHRYRYTKFATFEADVAASFIPVLNDEHLDYKWVTLEEALQLNLHPGLAIALTEGSGVAMDASPTKEVQRALERWGAKWQKKFDLMSAKISLEFADKSESAAQVSMRAAFKRAGFTVAFKPTRKSIAAYQAVAAEQVGLIKSIAQKYHTDVATKVWESVKRGADMKTLSQGLAKQYNITRKRAALIARDQNAKAKAVIEAVRHQELGIKQAIWMHSHAGKEPRPTHVRMNNKLYDLDRGMWDSDEQKFVHPGQLINCRCTMRPYIPGFESAAYPEWEIAQT